MTARGESERDWIPPSYNHQSSFDLHHYDHIPVSVDQETVKSSGVEPRQVPWWTSKRFRLSVLCFLGFSLLYAQRYNLSIAMVCMVQTNINTSLGIPPAPGVAPGVVASNNSISGQDDTCPAGEQLPPDMRGELDWDKSLQGLLLGAFFFGFLVLQIPAVLLSNRFGAKKVIAAGMFPVAVFTILSPVAAQTSPYLLLVFRVFIGLGQAVVYPASQTLWAGWAPPWERGRLVGIAMSGSHLGTALTFPTGGLLCQYGFHRGWPSIFYIGGSLGLLWCVLWVIFAHDRPESTPGISDIEKKYISHSLEESNKQQKPNSIPWRSMLSSGSVWALLLAHLCGNYGTYMLLTQLPTFMQEVLKFPVLSIGIYSMLPYLCLWMFTNLSGLLADYFIFRNILSVSWTRKVLTLIGLGGPGLCLIGVANIHCTAPAAAVVLLCVTIGLSGFQFSGYFINHGDIAPAHAGTLFALTNTAASLSGILAPIIAGSVTFGKTPGEWQTAFYICAGVYIFGALVFLVFSSGKPRHWARVFVQSKDDTVALRKPIVNGKRKSRASMRNTYVDNEESHVTIECDPGESYAESAIV